MQHVHNSHLQTSKIIQWIYSLLILYELVELPAILDIFCQLVNTTSTSTGVMGSHKFEAERVISCKNWKWPKASIDAVFSEVHMSQNVANYSMSNLTSRSCDEPLLTVWSSRQYGTWIRDHPNRDMWTSCWHAGLITAEASAKAETYRQH